MKKFFHIYLYLLPLLMLLLSGACTSEHSLEPGSDGNELVVNATITPRETLSTRADIQLNYDGWSYTHFNTGDKMGLYSEHGDYNEDKGNDSFINLPLTYEGNNQFKNDDNIEFSPSRMTPETMFMYFPYSEKMLDNQGSSMDATGMELRKFNEGFYKCTDVLDMMEISTESLAGGAIIGKFRHAFAELIIMRGEGFNDPPAGKEEIWVVMQNPYTHLKINYSLDPWFCSPQLVNETGYKPENWPDSETFNAQRWQAWQGGNYTITEEDKIGVPAWYALIPCLGTNNTDFTVSYIELYDNEGNLQQVTSLSLAPNPSDSKKFTKYVNESWRYPLLVEMKELVPTVNPYPIIPWEGDTDLTNERKRGISNAFDLQTWLNYYNAYLGNGEYQNLMQYGDRVVDTEGNFLYWHFYLLDDIDLSEMNNENTNTSVLIPELKDILDGVNMNEMSDNTRPNHSITGLDKTLIGKMSGYGALQNINFESPDVRTNSTDPVGILVNSIVGSPGNYCVIDNCNINRGTLTSNGPVGIIAGSIRNTRITNCEVSGFILGTSTLESSPYLNMVANQEGGNTVENNVSTVIFKNVN